MLILFGWGGVGDGLEELMLICGMIKFGGGGGGGGGEG